MSRKILSLFCIIAVGLFLALAAPVVHALTAVNFENTAGLSLGEVPFTLGWEFTANANIQATSLGLFDSGQDGLLDSHAIGLWNSAENLLVSTTIPSGTAAPLVDGKFRFVSVTPTNLTAGENYIIGALFLPERDQLIGGPFGAPIDFSTDPNITLVTSGFFSGGSLAFPGNSSGVTGYFGPNFTFTAAATASVPEPSTLIFLGSGLVGLAGFARKKLKK